MEYPRGLYPPPPAGTRPVMRMPDPVRVLGATDATLLSRTEAAAHCSYELNLSSTLARRRLGS
jgi:hypothetical protein